MTISKKIVLSSLNLLSFVTHTHLKTPTLEFKRSKKKTMKIIHIILKNNNKNDSLKNKT